MLTNKQVLLIKTETTEGVAETPSADTDACLLLKGGTPTPSGEKVGSDRLSATLSKEPHKIGQLSMGLSVPCELRGGGIVGDVVNEPDFDPMLRACAMKKSVVVFLALGEVTGGIFAAGETVTGGTSLATGKVVGYARSGLLLEEVVGVFVDAESVSGGTSSASATSLANPVSGWQYMPASADVDKPSLTAVRYHDGHKFVLAGARGTFVVNFEVGDIAKLDFTLNGRWANPVQEDNPTPVLNITDAPLVVDMGLAVGPYEPMGVTALSLDIANTVSKAQDVNAADGVRAFRITDRTPVGGMDPEAESLGNYNPWQDWKGGETSALSFALGSVAGNRIFVSMPKVQRTSVAYGDREGLVSYDESFELKRDVVGDDELRLVFF